MSTELAPPQAADLTEQEWNERVDEAQKVHERVLNGMTGLNVSGWFLANAFYDVVDTTAWTTLGYGSLNEYLASPEIGYARSNFMAHVAAWREFIVNQEIDPKTIKDIAPYKLALAAVKVHKGEADFEQAIADARSLPWGDYRDKYGKRAQRREITEGAPTSPTVGPAEPNLPSDAEVVGTTGDEAAEEPNMATTPDAESGHVERPPQGDDTTFHEGPDGSVIVHRPIDAEHANVTVTTEPVAEDAASPPEPMPVLTAQGIAEPDEGAQRPGEATQTTESGPGLYETRGFLEQIISAYHLDPNPVKHTRKPLREAIEAAEQFLKA